MRKTIPGPPASFDPSISRRMSLYSFVTVALYSFSLAFFPLYCNELGFTPWEIAILSAGSTAATILGSPLSLQLAHSRLGARPLVLACSLASAVLYALLFFSTAFVPIACAWFLCLLAKRGADSIVDARAVRASAERLVYFEHIRVWGSIGFVVAGFLIGYFVDRLGSGVIIPAGFMNLLLVLAAAFMVAPLLPSSPAGAELHTTGDQHDDRRPYLLSAAALLGSNALLWGSTAALYVYLSIYLEALGWSATKISIAWNIGVLAEIILFFYFPRIESRFTLKQILQISYALSVVRWIILGTSTSSALLLFSQVLHAFTFAGCYLASAKLVFVIFPERLKDRGQGIAIAFGQGLGSICGRLLVGAWAASLPSYLELDRIFLGSSAAAMLALLVSHWICPERELTTELSPETPGGRLRPDAAKH